jgi:hypothetical protein
MAELKKPVRIKTDEYKNALWDSFTEGRDFDPADAPLLIQLIDMCAIAEQCAEDVDNDGHVTLCYSDDHGNIKALPQVAQLTQVSKAILKLKRELGITTKAEGNSKKRKEVTLHVIQSQRRTRAENSRSAATG